MSQELAVKSTGIHVFAILHVSPRKDAFHQNSVSSHEFTCFLLLLPLREGKWCVPQRQSICAVPCEKY